MQFGKDGWPDQCEDDLKPFVSRKQELSLHKGGILWGTRVVIPERGQQVVLNELHEGHSGMTRMKSLARIFVWWPRLDKEVKSAVQNCTQCQETQTSPAAVPMYPWRWPTRPWSRLNIDYGGPLLGQIFLVVIDTDSKWIEVFPTTSATSSAMITMLQSTFAHFGLPETIVSDNGSCFFCDQFKSFLSQNGIKHITSAPYHPSSNGLAERVVQILKTGLRKNTRGSLQTKTARILLDYRSTPHSTTGVSPSELLIGRRIKIQLDLLKQNLAKDIVSSVQK